MSAAYDLYQAGASWLHRLDARVKLLWAVCASLVLLSGASLGLMVGMLVLTHLLLASARVGWRRILWVWQMAWPTMAMIIVLWLLLYPAPPGEAPLVALGPVRISAGSVARALAVALRLGALALVMFVWLFTTDPSALVRSLVALGVPYPWGLTLGMALRYLPTMASILHMIRDAQRARALDIDHGGPLQRARAHLPIIVAMIITALRTAENLSRALETRALGASPRRTALHPLRFRRADGVCAALILLATLAVFALRLLSG
jgi:energy-coupling factor transport system permease protein